MSSDQGTPKGGDTIEDLPASDDTTVTEAENVRGGLAVGGMLPGVPGVKPAPNGDADYLPYGKKDPIPGFGRP